MPPTAFFHFLLLLLGVLGEIIMGAGSSSLCKTSLPPPPIVHTFATAEQLGHEVGSRLLFLSQEAIAQRGEFTIAFSGGSLPALVAPFLVEQESKFQFSKWKIYFADERHVPVDHPDSNQGVLQQVFLSKLSTVGLPVVFGINDKVPVQQAAQEYQALLPGNKMDVILLGMGPDGHTASLFPGHAILDCPHRVGFIVDSPKPPPERITLSLKYINQEANHVFFVSTGSAKQDVVARCAIPVEKLEPNPLPSARVRPLSGSLEWFLDQEAAAKL